MIWKKGVKEAVKTLKPYIVKLSGISNFLNSVKVYYEKLNRAQIMVRSHLRRKNRNVQTMRQVFYRAFREYKFDLEEPGQPAASKTMLKSLEEFNWQIAYDFCHQYVTRCF